MSVKADVSASTDLLGKSVTDLQSNVSVGKGEITGTLKYVTGYTGFSGDTSEQSGNYLVLHCTSEDDGAVITAQLIGGIHDAVTLDEDGIIIFHIANTSQVVKITSTVDGETREDYFNLNKLVLETA